MKKYLTTAVIGLIALLTVTSSFAKGKSSEKDLAIPAGATVTKLKTGTIVIDGNTTTAYDKKGNMVYTIQRYSADNLPLDVFKTVRATYGNYYIAGIEKVEQPGSGDVIFVHMQDNTVYKTAKISNDGSEITQEFTKQ